MVEERAAFAALADELTRALHDPRRAREAGAALDAIARGKRYRLLGHATFDAFVRGLGISRPTAHRLRTLARAPQSLDIPRRGKTAAYEAARALVREGAAPSTVRGAVATRTRESDGAARARSRKRTI